MSSSLSGFCHCTLPGLADHVPLSSAPQYIGHWLTLPSTHPMGLWLPPLHPPGLVGVLRMSAGSKPGAGSVFALPALRAAFHAGAHSVREAPFAWLPGPSPILCLPRQLLLSPPLLPFPRLCSLTPPSLVIPSGLRVLGAVCALSTPECHLPPQGLAWTAFLNARSTLLPVKQHLQRGVGNFLRFKVT